MKSNTYFLFLLIFLFIGLTCFTQNTDTISNIGGYKKEKTLEQQTEIKKIKYIIEILPLGGSFFINRNISKKGYLSMGAGAGYAFNFFVFKPSSYPNINMDYFSTFLSYTHYLGKDLNFDFGIAYTFIFFGYNELTGGEDAGTNLFGYISGYTGFKCCKIGSKLGFTRLKIGNSNPKNVLILYPLVIRFYLN